MVKCTAASKHDHTLLKYLNLAIGSFLTFDRAYVDYAAYEKFSQNLIYYITKLKSNAKYISEMEIDIPDEADSGILRDEVIQLNYGENKKLTHKSSLTKSKLAFSTMISIVKNQLMYYVNLIKLLNNPIGTWIEQNKKREKNNQLLLFET